MLALLALAARAAPLLLPPGEPAGAWSHALAKAGLEASAPAGAGDTWAALVATPAGWRLEIHRAGATRTVPVDPPVTDAARERVAVLAASLLRGVEGGALPSLPALPPPPPRTPPAPVARRAAPKPADPAPEPVAPPPADPAPAVEPAVTVEPVVAAEPPAVEEEPAVAVADPAELLLDPVTLLDPEAAPATASVTPWVHASGGVAWRAGCVAAPTARLTAGLAPGALGGALALGAGAAWTLDQHVPELGADRGFSSTDGFGGAWLLPTAGPVTLGVGALVGVSRRAWHEGADRVGVATRGVAGGEIVARIPAGPLELGPTARVTTDLASSPLGRNDEIVGYLSPTQLALELSVGPRSPRRAATPREAPPRSRVAGR